MKLFFGPNLILKALLRGQNLKIIDNPVKYFENRIFEVLEVIF